jgi:hypothetical protein
MGASGLNDGFCFYGNGSCGQVTYHGGPIMHNTLAVILLWAGCGSNGCLSCSTGYFDNATIDPTASNPNDCTYGSLQYDYLRDFCAAGNPLFRVIDQYTDRSGSLGSCSVYGGKWYYAYNPFPEKPLTDADIQTEAMAVLNGFGINASTNTEVFVFTPYGVSSCAGSNDCFPTGTFCAYHNWFWAGTPYLSEQVVYSSMPDAGWAGGNCGLGGPSPNHDPWADLEISPLSHEADESFTDPTPGYLYGDGWYYRGYNLEVGDECAYDFAGTQPADGSNVRLGVPGTTGDSFRIQSEWSNINGGCTLDLKGPPTLVQETLDQDVSTGTPASTQHFPIHYQEAGETGSFASLNSTCCGVATDFYATLGSSFTTDPVLGQNEHWCFDDSCSNRTSYVLGFTALEFYYFDLLQQSASYEVSGGGPIPTPNLSYETAPAGETPGDSSAAEILLLSNGVQDFWSLRGSTITIPLVLAGAAERWTTKQATWAASTADAIPSTIVYHHQYPLNFSYSVVDGGAPIPPDLKFFQLGASQDLFLGTAPATYWLDSGTSYQANNILSGSTSTERWVASQTSGAASGPVTVTFVYYHQYYVNASYSVIDGGAPAAPSLNVDIMGTPSSYQMTQSPVSTWIDANSWSAPNMLAGSGSLGERWAATGKTNGTLSSNSPIAIVYYHQFEFDVKYSVSDNSMAIAPRLTSESFGNGFSMLLVKSAGSFWFDGSANWNLDYLLNGSGPLERWVTNSPTGGVVSAPLTASFEYLHEYYVTIQTAQTEGGNVPPTAWYNATTSLVLAANANDGWQFERWDGMGPGNYSGTADFRVVTIISPLVENATFYPGLTLVSVGNGQISYHWGASQGTLPAGAITIYVPVGTNVSLVVNPSSVFFTFDGYKGSVDSGRTASSIVVDAPAVIDASFSTNYPVLGIIFGSVGLAAAAVFIFRFRRTKTTAA